jgi:hypothetical protein
MNRIRHKFKAKPQKVDGIHFASKKEAAYYHYLNKIVENGEVLFFLRQVPLHLPGGVKYVCDFVVFWENGEVTFEDVKGFRTEVYKIKKKMIESRYPIEIIEV